MLALKYTLPDGQPNRRRLFSRASFRRKLPFLIVVPFVLMVTVLCVVDYSMKVADSDARRIAAFDAMMSERETALNEWYRAIENDMRTIAVYGSPATMIKEFSTAWQALGDTPGSTLRRLYIDDNPNVLGEKDLLDDAGDGSYWSRLHGTYHNGLRTMQRQFGYYDVFLFNLECDLIYTVFKEVDFGTNLQTGPYADSGLGQVFRGARDAAEGALVFSKFESYAPSGGAAANFVATPILDGAGQRVGVLALQIPIGRVAEILSRSALLEETGQIYLVGPDGRARSASTVEGGHAVLDPLPDLPQITAALNDDRQVFTNVPGLDGQMVEAQGRSFDFAGQTWGMVREQDMSEAGALAADMRRLLIVEVVLVAVFALGVGLLLARSLTRRISELAESVEEVSRGNLAAEVNQLRTGDEIGDIARTLLLFKNKLTEADHANAEREVMMAEQRQVVSLLQEALENLARGILDCRIEAELGADYEGLRKHFNAAVDELTQIIAQVSATAVEIEGDTERLNGASEQLSIRTENQAATLEQSTAALQQITTTVQASARDVQSIVSVINHMRTGTDRSSAVKNRAVEAMSRIEDSSKKIAQIIGVIEDIAFQTNLLALNAGVEAARAGEVGRGFAVVASEVRALAQRSHDSAGEIRDLISSSAKSVQDGVELVSDLGQGIDEISEMTRDISGRVQSIASSSEDQSRALSDVNTGVIELDGMTQKNAGMVMEFGESGKALTAKALELRRMVAHFKGTGLQALAPTVPIPTDVAAGSAAPSRWDDPRAAGGDFGAAAQKRLPKAATAGPWQDF